MSGLSRRRFLTGLSAGVGAGAGALAVGGCQAQSNEKSSTGLGGEQPADTALVDARLQTATVDFDGAHQAGITQPPQAHANIAAFRLKDGVARDDIARLLKLWTEDARRLTAGIAPAGTLEPELLLAPANLTITVGFGPGLFRALDAEHLRPAWLEDLPDFSRDQLDPAWGQQDLVLQIASDEPITATYALRHMLRSGQAYAELAWLQQGFNHADGSKAQGTTARNLFGQFDGTVNPRSDEEFDNQVFIDSSSDDPDWIHDGSAMIIRRIRMHLDRWEMLDRSSRENTIGRKLDTGAPLTGDEEFDDADFEARDKYGLPVIDPNSHMARARNSEDDPKEQLLRRPFSYDLPPEPGDGELSNSGLIFVCFQKDPRDQFIPIQQRLDEADLLNEWITHIGSSVWAVPAGTDSAGKNRDSYWGQSLIESL